MIWKSSSKTVTAVLLACVVFSIALATWSLQTARQAKAAAQAAIEERDRALKAERESVDERRQARAAVQTADQQRNRTEADVQQARHSADDAEAALAFVRDKILSAGRPLDWTAPPQKDVTLREAVDDAEPQVAGAFPDRPLAEALVRSTLGWTYFYLGEPQLAAQQYEQALVLRESVLGPDDPTTVGSRNDLARAYRLAGRVDKAGSLYNRKAGTRADAMILRASTLLEKHRAVQAETILRECLTNFEEAQPDEWSTFNVTSMLGQALFEQKKYDDAEPLLLSGYEGLKEHKADIPPASKDCLEQAIARLVKLFEATGKKDDAAKWKQELQTVQAGAKS